MPAAAAAEDSPSYHRRKALRDGDAGNNNMSIIATYPLEKYFEISNRLLHNFQKALDERRLDETYVYGIRFCTFSVQALPKHPNYNQARYKNQRLRNSHRVDKVLKTMEVVTQRMDVEETVKRQQEQERLEEERKRQEAERKRQEAERKLAEEEAAKRRAKVAEENTLSEQKNMEQSAYAKLQALKDRMTTPAQPPAQPKQQQQQLKEEKPSKSAPTKNDKTKKITEMATESTKTKKQPAKETPKTSKRKEAATRKPTKPANTKATTDTARAPATQTPPPLTTKDTANSVTTTATATSTEPNSRRRRRAATKAEEKTLERLDKTIRSQEARLEQISAVQIPTLLKEAKRNLRDGNRKAALSCVRKKRKLEQMADISKNAIFQLETQIFQIENALEDRQVHQALQAASQAMDGLTKAVGVDADTLQEDLTAFVASSADAVAADEGIDEEELLQELEQWTTPQKKKTKTTTLSSLEDIDDDDNISILSLPNVPSNKQETQEKTYKTSNSVRNLLKAVLG